MNFEGDAISLLITIGNPTNDEELLRLSTLTSGSVFDQHSTRNGEAVSIRSAVQDGVSVLTGEPPVRIDAPASVRLRPLERATRGSLSTSAPTISIRGA